jgi:hypothetical protein
MGLKNRFIVASVICIGFFGIQRNIDQRVFRASPYQPDSYDTIKQIMEEFMEMRLSFRRQRVTFVAIGVFVITGAMIMSQQLEWISGQNQQTDAVKPEDKNAVSPNVYESELAPAAKASPRDSVMCWHESGSSDDGISCSSKWYYCYFPGWKSVPPSPPYCTVIY